MTSKQVQLVCSWLLMLISLYIAFKVNITFALVVGFFVIFFRDAQQEKIFTAILIENNMPLIQKAKYYSLATSIVVLIVVVYLLLNEDAKYLRDYKLIGMLLAVILWPFIALGVFNDILLFKEYRKGPIIRHR